jgi:hypothetical protein
MSSAQVSTKQTKQTKNTKQTKVAKKDDVEVIAPNTVEVNLKQVAPAETEINSEPKKRARKKTAKQEVVEAVNDSEGEVAESSHESTPEPEETYESYEDVRRRSMSFLYDIESKYSNKNILIVTHGSPVWQMFSEVNGLTTEESLGIVKSEKNFNYLILKDTNFREFTLLLDRSPLYFLLNRP